MKSEMLLNRPLLWGRPILVSVCLMPGVSLFL